MKIYAVGDSFTAGSELMDWKYYTDFPGYMTAAQEHVKNQYTEWHKKKPWLHTLLGGHHSKQFHQAIEEQKNLTYANQLSQILDRPVINHGLGGCSLDTIVRNLTMYLDSATEPHVVFFQPTNPARWCQYYENTWRNFIAGNCENNVSVEFQKWMQLKIVLENTYSWTMAWWLNIKSALAQLQTHAMVQDFYILDSGVLTWIETQIKENEQEYYRDDLGPRVLKMLDHDIGPHRIKFTYDHDEDVICPGGHLNHIVHRRLAEELADILK